MEEQPEVLFVCVHNAGRSQMAAGLVKLRSGGGAVLAGTAGADDRAEAVGRLGQCVRSDRFPPRGVTPLTPIMGRATDPGENHDPGNDQRFTPSLTQEPRLENGLGHDLPCSSISTTSIAICGTKTRRWPGRSPFRREPGFAGWKMACRAS